MEALIILYFLAGIPVSIRLFDAGFPAEVAVYLFWPVCLGFFLYKGIKDS
jgi:hypothetical protein